jgi:sulfate adenylyltransferase large subunit
MPALIETQIPETLEDFLSRELHKELLRFTTAGSVDDGKSTLIGRLLHDCKAVYEDQLASVKRSPVNRSGKEIDFSLLTDGLRAEREQGITIDVAYRYFSTPRRKFIIADTPGHEQYTRNMATGASTADLAIILLDATKGVLAQTRRHAYIASLLGIPNLVAAINKMDLVGYDEKVFGQLREDFLALAHGLGTPHANCIPISALEGDNIVQRSRFTPWYSGPTLLEHLESVPLDSPAQGNQLRFPVQSVIRPDATFRGFAGRIASGVIRPGDRVVALPSGRETQVQSIVSFEGDRAEAMAGESIVLKLSEEIDLSRGDMLVSPETAPNISMRFGAMVVWLHPQPLQLDKTYLLKHAGRYVKARATRIRYCVDVNNLTQHAAGELAMNDIGFVEIESVQPLFLDSYGANRITGSLILIDPVTNATIGAAMVREALIPERDGDAASRIEIVGESRFTSSRTLDIEKARVERHGHRAGIFSLKVSREDAARIEMSLHDSGFEVALVNHNDVPSVARQTFYWTLLGLGLVVLIWSEKPIRLKDQALFRELAGDSYYEFADTHDSADFQNILSSAQKLRLSPRSTQSKDVADA